VADVPYRYDRTASAAQLQERHQTLGPGEESDEVASVAGRVMLMRPQGRLAFATLRDSSGQIQLFALEKTTERFGDFSKLSLGDWVGASGPVVRTRKSRPGSASARSTCGPTTGRARS
jgi:lysyl-tRNA synthetase, class II